jgi:lysyl-tRNA synthetase class 2
MGIEVDKTMGRRKSMKFLEQNAKETTFSQHLLLIPKEMSPLCKEHRDNPEIDILN